MKPHQLRMEAFGPYAEPAEIDFDALSDEGLFLIYGSTGAGKTFLLDALSYALYGEVSGDRNVKALKSDHADPAAVPRVSLVFSCGGGRYRVERSPGYTAPKTRGVGFTEKAAQAVLFRLNGSDAEPIVSRTTEVSREVEQLVGLNAAQFRQVILLPQGQFAEVLRAKAEEREALLKTLFDTVAFEQAGFWLEDQAKAARLDLAECTRAQEVLRRQAAQAWSPFASPPPLPDQPDVPDAPDAPDLDGLQQQIDLVLGEPRDDERSEVVFRDGLPQLRRRPAGEAEVQPWGQQPAPISLDTPGKRGSDCLRLHFQIDGQGQLVLESVIVETTKNQMVMVQIQKGLRNSGNSLD